MLCGLAFGPLVRRTKTVKGVLVSGALAGGSAVILTGALVCLVLVASGREFVPAAKVIMATFLPLIVIEGAVTASALAFLKRVSPQLLEAGG